MPGRETPIHATYKIKQGIKMTEPQGGCTRPHYLELFDRLSAAPDDETWRAILASDKAERAHK
jgi:hypothetical protein